MGESNCGCADCAKRKKVPGPTGTNPCPGCTYTKGTGSNDGSLAGTLRDDFDNYPVSEMSIELAQGTTSLNTYTSLSPDGGSASDDVSQTISGSGTYNSTANKAYLRFKQTGSPTYIGPFEIPVYSS